MDDIDDPFTDFDLESVTTNIIPEYRREHLQRVGQNVILIVIYSPNINLTASFNRLSQKNKGLVLNDN